MRLTPLALAAGLLACGGAARSQTPVAAQAPAALEASPVLKALPRGPTAKALPTLLQAERISSQVDRETVAEGNAEFRRGGLVIRADRLGYDDSEDLATARGKVSVRRDNARYSGPEMQLHVQRFEGFFLQPEFQFLDIGAGGRAKRIDFLDESRSRAIGAEYTSCPRDGPEEPAWLLRTDKVTLDLERSEGVADGAVLRFLGVPILALPTLSFPLSDTRRSGWLPPTVDTDNRSGLELAVPYYWNIAPNRDATITPRVITRRGIAVNTEFRYLEPDFRGGAAVDWLPNDRLTGHSREALQWTHEGQTAGGVRFTSDVARVSDDEWWKDFPNANRAITPRLLPLRLSVERPFDLDQGRGLVYARAVRWQVLQGSESPVVAPYERSPQIGVRLGGGFAGNWEYSLESEFNRFTLPAGEAARNGRSGGERWHALGSVSRPWREPNWFIVPRVSVNAASYSDTGLLPEASSRASRVIPTFSLDAGLELDRTFTAFGRSVRQTLEPRVLYVQTPYRQQSQLPNYDAAAKDFNFSSIYTDNQFAGIDRVSDAHSLTAGVTTRFVDAASGAEAMRLGLVQRYLFRTQRVTAQVDGSADGAPIDQRLSDALLLGSTSVFPGWTLDSAVQYSPDIRRSVLAVAGARYSPQPLHTVSTTYRLARGLTEQLEIGWQWPVWSRQAAASSKNTAGSSACVGTVYSVGRVNYSLRDSRVTDSVLGVEYDAGCWIGRVVGERLSTGRSEATTRIMFQLELVGLSRIGSNPLQVLKDNIPGYRLLRDERRGASPTDDRLTAPSYD